MLVDYSLKCKEKIKIMRDSVYSSLKNFLRWIKSFSLNDLVKDRFASHKYINSQMLKVQHHHTYFFHLLCSEYASLKFL